MAFMRWTAAVLISLMVMSAPAAAGDKKQSNLPWKKAYLNVGWFFANLNSNFRIGGSGAGLGVSLDVEEFLGLETNTSSFRIDGVWRFTENKRHKLDFGWFGFHRESRGRIFESIEIPPGLGGGTIGPGEIESTFNFDIIRIMYAYSLILDERVDFNLGLGLFIMPIEFGVQAIVNGVGAQGVQEDITAPLPVLGVGLDLALTPKWFIRQDLELFYLEIDNFTGSIFSGTLALEYLPWKHVGFGLGVDGKRVQVEANGSDLSWMDFRGNVEFSYVGGLLYAKVFL